VYPKPKPKKFDPLRYLSDFFDTVEINSTFYRPAATSASTCDCRAVRRRRLSEDSTFR